MRRRTVLAASFVWAMRTVIAVRGQILSFAEPIEIDVRFGGDATVELACAEEILAWSFGVRHDPSLLDPVRMSLDGLPAHGVNGGRGPDFVRMVTHPAKGAGVTVEVIVSFAGAAALAPGARVGVARIRYAAGQGAKKGMSTRLVFAGDLGDPPLPLAIVSAAGPAVPATRPGEVAFTERPIAFVRADTNGNGWIDIGDAIGVLNHLFADQEVDCEDAVDANDDGQIDVGDAIYTLQYEFAGGPPPPPPYPQRGEDPTPDELSCLRTA